MILLRSDYRCSVQIILEVLKAISEKEEIRISILCRVSNLSHYVAKDKLGDLISKGFVKRNVIPGRSKFNGKKIEDEISYSLTPTGYRLLVDLKTFEELCQKTLGMSCIT